MNFQIEPYSYEQAGHHLTPKQHALLQQKACQQLFHYANPDPKKKTYIKQFDRTKQSSNKTTDQETHLEIKGMVT